LVAPSGSSTVKITSGILMGVSAFGRIGARRGY
jgi:hypothetical protein